MDNSRSTATGRGLAAAGIFAGLAGSLAVWYFDPSTVRFFPVCPLHALTGLSCPGCGLTRGFHALFHGDILTALQFNLLLPVYVLIGAYLAVSLSLVTVRGRGLAFQPFTPRTVQIFLFALLIFGVLRNLPVYPFTIFAV